jgi:hypothetical protein
MIRCDRCGRQLDPLGQSLRPLDTPPPFLDVFLGAPGFATKWTRRARLLDAKVTRGTYRFLAMIACNMLRGIGEFVANGTFLFFILDGFGLLTEWRKKFIKHSFLFDAAFSLIEQFLEPGIHEKLSGFRIIWRRMQLTLFTVTICSQSFNSILQIAQLYPILFL